MIFDEKIYKFMFAALQEAEKAMESGEIPIGAVIVYDNKIIGKGFNQVETLKDPTAHAEMLAITAASNFLKEKYLSECDIFITAEPCLMCSGAILLARIRNVFFAADEPKFGAAGSLFNILDGNKYNHSVNVFGGIYENEAKKLMSDFFSKKRKNK